MSNNFAASGMILACEAQNHWTSKLTGMTCVDLVFSLKRDLETLFWALKTI